MSKKLVAIVVVLVILLGVSATFLFSNKLVVDGKVSWLSSKPIFQDDVPYINLLTLAKLYNTTLDYDKHANLYTMEFVDHIFHFDVEQRLIKQNGEMTDYTMLVKNKKPYISEAFIERYFNVSVDSEESSKVELTSKNRIPILMYHTVNDRPNDTINTQPQQFEEQLKAIIDAGYNPISSEELYRYYYHQEQLPSNPIMLTFDDGYKDNYTNAYPILKKYNAKATIFTITSRIEHEGNNSYPNEIPKLTWEEINEMRDLVMVQSHTWDSHRKVDAKRGKQRGQIATPQMTADGEIETEEEYRARVINDIQLAQTTIKEKTGYDSYILSYPYGESSIIAREVAKSLGVKFGVTVHKELNYSYTHLFHLKRITVDGNFTGEQLLEKIEELKRK